jgi:hypothetical protein
MTEKVYTDDEKVEKIHGALVKAAADFEASGDTAMAATIRNAMETTVTRESMIRLHDLFVQAKVEAERPAGRINFSRRSRES